MVRAIGTLGLSSAIVNLTIGAGIFRLPASVAASLGFAAPIAYLTCAVAMGLIVWCIAEAGKRVSSTGGPAAYVAVALGGYPGFLAGILLWMLGTFATAAVSTVIAAGLGQLMPALSGRAGQLGVIAVVFTFWTAVNLRGVAAGSRLVTAATVAKLVPLLVVAVGGLPFVHPAYLRVDHLPPAGDLARASFLLVFAFSGVESALVPSGEVRDPSRTVPRAIVIAMTGVTVLYITLQIVAQGILGPQLARATSAPLADAASLSLGGWARLLVLWGATISTFGHLGGMTLAISRIVYALAGDGYLPRVLATVHSGRRVPHVAIVAQAALAFALAASGTFEQLASLGNVSALALYLGCAVAAWKMGGRAVVPVLAGLIIAWLLTGLTWPEWLAFGICIALATLAYVVRARTMTPQP